MIDVTTDVSHVIVVETSYDMNNRIDLPDLRQELIAETLSLRRPGY